MSWYLRVKSSKAMDHPPLASHPIGWCKQVSARILDTFRRRALEHRTHTARTGEELLEAIFLALYALFAGYTSRARERSRKTPR